MKLSPLQFLPGSDIYPEIVTGCADSGRSQSNLNPPRGNNVQIVSARSNIHRVVSGVCWINRCGYYPFISTITGLARTFIATAYLLNHFAKAVLNPETKKASLKKAKLGLRNIPRGIVESIPLIGNIAAYIFDRARIHSFKKTPRKKINNINRQQNQKRLYFFQFFYNGKKMELSSTYDKKGDFTAHNYIYLKNKSGSLAFFETKAHYRDIFGIKWPLK